MTTLKWSSETKKPGKRKSGSVNTNSSPNDIVAPSTSTKTRTDPFSRYAEKSFDEFELHAPHGWARLTNTDIIRPGDMYIGYEFGHLFLEPPDEEFIGQPYPCSTSDGFFIRRFHPVPRPQENQEVTQSQSHNGFSIVLLSDANWDGAGMRFVGLSGYDFHITLIERIRSLLQASHEIGFSATLTFDLKPINNDVGSLSSTAATLESALGVGAGKLVTK